MEHICHFAGKQQDIFSFLHGSNSNDHQETLCVGKHLGERVFLHLSHVRSWTGSRLHQQGAWTLVGSLRRGVLKERVPCRKSWPSPVMPAAVTVASQTPAGPASIWASPSVYSALVFTGKVL